MRLPKFYTRAVFIDDAGDAVEAQWNIDSGFLIMFNVDKTYRREPDSAEVIVHNLAPSIMRKISAEAVELELYAGYQDPPPLLFKGPVDDTIATRSSDHVDTITTVWAEDTKRQMREVAISRSYAAGTPLRTVYQDIAAGAGLPVDVRAVSGTTQSPLPLLGPPARILDEACRLYGYRYQMIAGVLVVAGTDDAITTPDVPVINKLSGLRGVPTSALEKKKIKVTAETTLDPLIQPGGLVIIETESTTGTRKAPIKASATYFVERVTSSFQGNQATSVVVGREYGPD